ncbi:MAG: PP2C family protein-serine/threonine phosphatase, partial [Planctomycetaceae bacterium]
MRRANNQDAYATLPADTAERYARRGHLFAVPDGMGAHAAGELASQMAAEKISQYYLKQSTLDAATALRLAVQEANADIHRRGQENPEFYNMGTTASSIAIGPQGVIVAHVGDSRVYRIRDGKLEQLTFDHSLVWEMQASGQIHPNSNLRHNIPKNVITRSLGPSEEVCVDIEGPFPVKKGDHYLLCSDGLTGQVADEEIGPLIEALPPDLAARVLVDLANLRGGPDNTTMIIVHITDSPGPEWQNVPTRRSEEVPVPWLVLGTAVFCFAAAMLLGVSGNIGPMVVGVVLGLIAAVVAAVQFHQTAKQAKHNQPTKKTVRTAPYRTFSAKPTNELLSRLSSVLDALRQAAAERKWA